jgi:5-oxopent-3-ene-1,2,5-tricarboxylate decarboxylase / 2-hydroxyhepta-2,4-diene-1,7-dioate isomerase
MKHALVTYRNARHWATAEPTTEPGGNATHLRLAGGEVIGIDQVEHWHPPLPEALVGPRTVACLGLNYANHAKELAFKPPTEPLVFLKGELALCGHLRDTVRPPHATHMHEECELAVVIGKTCKNLALEDALGCVLGYTVANDYAIRDDLENWYRPNLKVKNRPNTTPIGPWLTDAADVPNPQALRLITRVNGQVTQTGSTADMVFSVAFLISHLSQTMTLERGDVILTGTPEGVTNCPVGTVVECEIEGLGCLVNTIVAG